MTIELANRLTEYRKKANLSQEELAEKLGVSRQAVSKWERAEASPDTDNLIALAKLYNVSLDVLVGNKEDYKEEKINSKKETSKVDIGPGHIFVEDNDSKVDISLKGISVEDKNEFNGATPKIHVLKKKSPLATFFLAFEATFSLLIVVAYIIVGICYKGGMGINNVSAWAALWPAFILIPLPSSLGKAIRKKRFCLFAYPLLITSVYCFLGMLLNMWHPMWVLFLTIPIYYSLFGVIDKKISRDIDINIIDSEKND